MKLTKAQRALLATGPRFWGPRPGSNALPAVDLRRPDGQTVICDGEDIEALHRLGLVTADHKPGEGRVIDHPDGYTIDCDHRWTITDAGRHALEGGDG